MLGINDLKKTYPGGIQALKGISLEVPSGMFGLLGPNGAGKTTLMKIVATLLEPDSGTVEMNGFDLVTRKDKARRMLGYLPQGLAYPTPRLIRCSTTRHAQGVRTRNSAGVIPLCSRRSTFVRENARVGGFREGCGSAGIASLKENRSYHCR